MKNGNFVQVIVDVAHSNVDRIFDYELHEGQATKIGCRVLVPFGRTTTEGIVLRIVQETEVPEGKIKQVLRVIDEIPVVTEEQIQLAAYLCARYKTTMAFALRLMFPAKMRGERIQAKKVRVATVKDKEALKEERATCFTKEGLVRAKNKLKTIDALLEEDTPTAMLDNASLNKLVDKGLVEIYEQESYRKPYQALQTNAKELEFTVAQKNAVEKIETGIDAGENKTFLLHGVTGSGKTEVYMAACKHALAQGKTAMVLVPEISITPQILAEFTRHFAGRIAVFHSGLSDGERFDEWRRVSRGEADIVLGARSAVFMPLENIGVIVIDESHAESYKAENHPAYHAADVANMRAKMNDAVLVLASATPLVEDYAKAELGIYELIEMPERVSNLPLPTIEVVDMKREFMHGNRGLISGPLKQALAQTLSAGEQALIFQNRRGYSSSVMCASCGHALMCSHCDVPLKYHKEKKVLLCHHCGRQFPLSKTCPECGEAYLRYAGAGTQKVEEQLKSMFPGARILRMDFDTTRTKDAHLKIFEAFSKGEADILLGTQMISRGLDFSGVTLAGIISADSLLLAGDYRQDERTFSMIEQVGGRAGRKKAGKVIVQTYNPEHYAIAFAANHDYKGFYKTEIGFRKASQKPPFSRTFRMVFSHADENRAKQACEMADAKVVEVLERYKQDVLFHVAKEAPVAKLNGKSRYHIISKVKVNKHTNEIRDQLYAVFADVQQKGVLTGMDVDPYDVN